MSNQELYKALNTLINHIPPEELDTSIHKYLQTLPPTHTRVFLSVLSNIEYTTQSDNILSLVLPCVLSPDKHIAQTATTFLLTCGGTKGLSLLNDLLNQQEVSHAVLVRGLISLLT